MTTPRCIITGCALQVSDSRWVAGDLFDAGEFYMFNGNYNREANEPDWHGGEPVYSKRLQAFDYFERRAVFIIHKDDAQLNKLAQDYIS